MENDLLLIFCADSRARREHLLEKLQCTSFEWKGVFKKFNENKISCEALLPLIRLISIPKNVQTEIRENAENDRHFRKRYFELIVATNKLFSENKVKHVTIKLIEHPWVIMTDIDILPASPIEELKAIEALHKKNFRFYQFRLLSDPLKIMAKNTECNDLSIDFYPRPEWIGKKVSGLEVIMSNKRMKKIYGVNMIIPSPEDDILLIASHAYNHLSITLPDILHGLELIYNETIDWKYIVASSEKNGILHAIYTYLLFLDQYSRMIHETNAVPQEVVKLFRCYGICRKVEKWFRKGCSETFSFPIRIPFQMGIFLSATYRAKSIMKGHDFHDLLYDLLSHMLMLSSMVVRGFT